MAIKKRLGSGSMGMTPGMGGMGGPPMMRPPMMKPPVTRPPAPTSRPPLMKMKGAPLAGFAPGPKKAKKAKKKGMKIPGLMI